MGIMGREFCRRRDPGEGREGYGDPSWTSLSRASQTLLPMDVSTCGSERQDDEGAGLRWLPIGTGPGSSAEDAVGRAAGRPKQGSDGADRRN